MTSSAPARPAPRGTRRAAARRPAVAAPCRRRGCGLLGAAPCEPARRRGRGSARRGSLERSASAASVELRVGDEAQVDRVVLGDLVGVEVDVDDASRRARRARPARGRPPGTRRCRRSARRRRRATMAGAGRAEHVAQHARVAADARRRMFGSDESASHTSAPSSLGDAGSARPARRRARRRRRRRSPGAARRRAGRGRARRGPAPARRACTGRRRQHRLVVRPRRARPCGSATKTGPIGGVAAILMARRSTRSSEPRVDDPRGPLGHRRGHATRSAAIWASIAS